jgi:hypothetical protein
MLRHHAVITFNRVTGYFEIRALHKAGIYVKGVRVGVADGPIPLTSRTAIQVYTSLTIIPTTLI